MSAHASLQNGAENRDVRDDAQLVLRLEAVAATPQNRDRIEEQVRRLNRALDEAGTPFRLRLL